ncbi:MAG: HAMP domain-containing sensor histidine kinase [Tissierellia bacterium]|nr:HAMP domain-containing sensor histidine kinase [Tissierellia bacterium]
MKLNKAAGDPLLNSLYGGYISQCILASAVIVVITLLLAGLFQWLLPSLLPNYRWYYRAGYLYGASAAVWGASIVLLTRRLLKKVLAYLYELQGATRKLLDGDSGYIELSPELGEIAANLNELKGEAMENARLAREQEEKKNDLIMYLAHDLKTPLSSVIGYLTLLRDEGEISRELREKYLSIALGKAQRLEELINEFFEITRFNLSAIHLSYAKINLTRLLEQLAYEFRPMLAQKHLSLELNAPDELLLPCDPDKIQRVLDNLLRNAVLYSHEGTEIALEVAVGEEAVTITFTNEGDEIGPEKLERIFDPFYRLDPARRTGGGAGLGLSIAREIVALHGGSIGAESRGQEIKFAVSLPLS